MKLAAQDATAQSIENIRHAMKRQVRTNELRYAGHVHHTIPTEKVSLSPSPIKGRAQYVP